MKNLLTVELLSIRLHKSVTSIRSDATRNPKSLPPICRLPGTKRLLWREVDVDQWFAQHVADHDAVVTATIINNDLLLKAKRGRPTKRAQVTAERKSGFDSGNGRQRAAF